MADDKTEEPTEVQHDEDSQEQLRRSEMRVDKRSLQMAELLDTLDLPDDGETAQALMRLVASHFSRATRLQVAIRYLCDAWDYVEDRRNRDIHSQVLEKLVKQKFSKTSQETLTLSEGELQVEMTPEQRDLLLDKKLIFFCPGCNRFHGIGTTSENDLRQAVTEAGLPPLGGKTNH